MLCFNEKKVYAIIHLFVLVMKISILVKNAQFKEKIPVFFYLSYPKKKQGKVSIIMFCFNNF